MTFLAPLGLLGLVAAPLVMLLWLRFARYRSQRVSSLLLWIDVPAPIIPTRAWHVPPVDIQLVLQVLVTLALALALSRVAFDVPGGRHVALVLDASVSMQARDVSPSRFDAAREQLRNVLSQANATDRFDLVVASHAPAAVLRDVSAGAVQAALDQQSADDVPGDLSTALRVAAVPAVTEIVAATDGATRVDVSPQAAPITFRTIGGQADQLALSDVSLRQPIDGSQRLAGFANIANYGASPRSTRVDIVADAVLVDSQAIEVAPGARTEVTFSVPLETRAVRVALTQTDAVPFDKRVDIPAPPQFARTLVVVSDHPDLWERVLASLPFITTRSEPPAEYRPPAAGELTLFDGWTPPQLPDTERILVDRSAVVDSRTELIHEQDRRDPLLRGLDLAGLTITRDKPATVPIWASLTLGSADDFVLGHGLLEGRRTVVFGFDPSMSNLPQLAAFPELMSNTIDWLVPGRGEVVHAGLGAGVDVTPHTLPPIASAPDLTRAPRWLELSPLLVVLAMVAIAVEAVIGRRRRLLAAPLIGLSGAVTLLAAAALLQPAVPLPGGVLNVVLAVDRSAAAVGVDAALDQAQRAPQAGDSLGIADGADIGRALRLAGALARPGNGERIVLVSDGHATTGDTAAALESLNGVPVDVLPVEALGPSSVLESLDVPAYVRLGDSFDATLSVGAPAASNLGLQVLLDGRVLREQPVSATAGHTRIPIGVSMDTLGPHRLAVKSGDAVVEGVVTVKPPERVMVVEERPGESAGVLAALKGTPASIDVVAPGSIGGLSKLEPYDALVLANVSATSFTLDQQRTLQSFVRDRGRGLVALGGSTSFVLGDYEGSVLEQTLPLESTIPPRREGARMALLLVIDISQSMDRVVDGVASIDMAKQAAILASRSLRDDDQVGVLIFNHRYTWLQPIGVISTIGRANLEDRIVSLSASGGTEIFAALNEGATAIRGVSSDLRHIVLFTDGNSRDANYDALTADLRKERIGLSTVGLGPEADTKLLSKLARDGQGRFYYSDRPSELPRILATEVAIAKRSSVVEGSVQPQMVAPSPILRGIVPEALPVLTGHILTTRRPTASVVLASPDNKPLLAHWRYGLGRAVAWTSDVGGPWTRSWADWSDNARLWQQAVSWAAGVPVQPDFQVSVSTSGSTADITLDEIRDDQFVNLAAPRAQIAAPGGPPSALTLHESAPGRYTASVVVPAGSYTVTVIDGERSETNGFVVAADPDRSSSGADVQTLRRIASDTGGRVLVSGEEAFGQDVRTSGQHWQPIWPALLAIALALFVLRVAWSTNALSVVGGAARRLSARRRGRG